jgi:hypothetical protein
MGGERRDSYRKPKDKRPMGRLRRRLMENIKMDLREIGCDGMEWVHLAQDSERRTLINTVMNLRVP